MAFLCVAEDRLKFTAPAQRLGNVLRFCGENTRESEKSVKLSLGDFFCSPTDRFHAPFTAKPGHISQSPRSALGAMRLNISIGIRDGAGAGENQRFMALEVASYCTDRNTDPLGRLRGVTFLRRTTSGLGVRRRPQQFR